MKPHHLYGACPPDKVPEWVSDKGYTYPMEVSPALLPYFRWRYPKRWIVPATSSVIWLDVLLEIAALVGDVLIVAGMILATILVAVGFVLALPGRAIEYAGKELGYRVWKV